MIRHIPRKHYTEEKDILFDTFQQLPMMPSGAELSKDSLLFTQSKKTDEIGLSNFQSK